MSTFECIETSNDGKQTIANTVKHLVFLWTAICSNVSKFLDRQIWVNSADPDQTASLGAV